MATKKRAAKKKRETKRDGEVVGLKLTEATIESGKTPTVGGEGGQIGFDYILPPDVPVHYIDNVNVLHTGSEFTLSFMQSQPPLLRTAAEWNEVKTIPSRCVVRLIVSPMKMQLLVNTLAKNFQQYLASFIQEEGDANDNTKADRDGGTL